MIKSQTIYYQSKHDLMPTALACASHPSQHALLQVFVGSADLGFIKQLQQELTALFPQVPIIGTSSAGEIHDGQVTEGQTLITLSRFNTTSVQTALASTTGTITQSAYQLADELAQPNVLILFGSGLQNQQAQDANTLLQTLKQRLPTTLISGGLAGAPAPSAATYVFNEHDIMAQGVVAAALSGTDLIAHNHYNLSWVPVGKQFTITKVSGRRVLEIDGRTPYQLYTHYLGSEIAANLPESAADFPLMSQQEGRHIAVHVSAVYDDGSFEYLHHFHAGEQVRFGFCHSDLLAMSAKETYDALAPKAIDQAFIYSCASRKRVLGSELSLELAPVVALAPVAGLFAHGEFYTHQSGLCRFFTQTMTVLTLAERGCHESQTLTARNWQGMRSEDSQQLKTLQMLHRLVERSTAEIEKANEELALLANKDFLTGLTNRRGLEEKLNAEIQRCARSTKPLALLLLDIDYFKPFNDRYGHVAGDACLRGIAHEIDRTVTRAADMAARYGGEEFICVLPELEHQDAIKIAEKIRTNIKHLAITHSASKVAGVVTISVGLLTISPSQRQLSAENLIKQCDQQLYRAKGLGRDQVCAIQI